MHSTQRTLALVRWVNQARQTKDTSPESLEPFEFEMKVNLAFSVLESVLHSTSTSGERDREGSWNEAGHTIGAAPVDARTQHCCQLALVV